jgi:hypothetical protein
MMPLLLREPGLSRDMTEIIKERYEPNLSEFHGTQDKERRVNNGRSLGCLESKKQRNFRKHKSGLAESQIETKRKNTRSRRKGEYVHCIQTMMIIRILGDENYIITIVLMSRGKAVSNAEDLVGKKWQ